MTRSGRLASALLLATTLLAADCSDQPAPPRSAPSPATTTTRPPATSAPPASPAPTRSPAQTAPGPRATVSVTGVVARGLEVPWSIAFLPDGAALVSERNSGRILRLPPGGGEPREVGRLDVAAAGEAGLLGLAVSPRFATDRLVFAYFTSASDNRVVRMRLDGDRLDAPRVVLSGIAKGFLHDGGRIAFGPDGFLYVANGDAGDAGRAQDRGDLNGKILRITADGRPAPGNPFPGSPVWSYGHRNVQGLAWDSHGRLWASEFGQHRWDELNLIEPGRNYGWPLVEGPEEQEGLTPPQRSWRPDENSPSGIAIAGDAGYMAALAGERLWQIPVDAARAGEPRDFFTGRYGRLRAVVAAPDGSLWVSTSNRDGRGDPRDGDDQILRVQLR